MGLYEAENCWGTVGELVEACKDMHSKHSSRPAMCSSLTFFQTYESCRSQATHKSYLF